MSDIINTISTGTTSTGTTASPWDYCAERLPCGLCQKTNMICPYYSQKIEITWQAGRGDVPYVINQCEVKT